MSESLEHKSEVEGSINGLAINKALAAAAAAWRIRMCNRRSKVLPQVLVLAFIL